MDAFARGGLRFDVVDAGPADGEVVLCLHGFPQDSAAYAGVLPLLTARGLRVLVPDQRGYSPGARPGQRRDYALRELVADAVALLDAAGAPRAHVVGHDWGGVVAWALAAWFPERVSALTALSQPHPAAFQSAVLTSTQAVRSTYVAAFQLPLLPERLLLAGDGRLLSASLQRSGLPADLARGYAHRMGEPGRLTAALDWYRALPHAGRVGPVDVPVTYLHGRRDPFYAPAAVLGTSAHVRGSSFRRQALGIGHWVPELAPQAVADAVLDAVAAHS